MYNECISTRTSTVHRKEKNTSSSLRQIYVIGTIYSVHKKSVAGGKYDDDQKRQNVLFSIVYHTLIAHRKALDWNT